MARATIDLLQGTLDVLVLKVLSWKAMHGYDVVRAIQALTDNVLTVEEGSLYPALHRLERQGWLQSDWGLSDNNRRAKFYRLTSEGRRHLRAETTTWSRFAHAVSSVLSATASPI